MGATLETEGGWSWMEDRGTWEQRVPERAWTRGLDAPMASSRRAERTAPSRDMDLGRVIRVLDLARAGKASPQELTEASLALRLVRERLVDLFTFPAFPEEREGVCRLGTWESLPRKQRAAYAEIKAMLAPHRS